MPSLTSVDYHVRTHLSGRRARRAVIAGAEPRGPTHLAAPSEGSPPAAAGFPHHLELRTSVTYTRAPTRGYPTTSTRPRTCSPSVSSHMVGDFGVNGDGPVGQPVPRQYLTGFHQVPDISTDYFTLEELVGLNPDFSFRGLELRPQVGTNLTPRASPTTASRPWRSPNPAPTSKPRKQTVSIDDTYQDLKSGSDLRGPQTGAGGDQPP